MSCPSSRSNRRKKPTPTKAMKQKQYDYVWQEVNGNPNLYCWVPKSQKDLVKSGRLDPANVNIQDIPAIKVPKDFGKRIEQLVGKLEDERKKRSRQILRGDHTDQDVVSHDVRDKYKIVKQFLQNTGRVIYGGAAINYYLPKEAKIYSAKTNPDFDFFSPDPWNDAIDLADRFYQAGYRYVEARGGIHKGTYKVFVNLWPVADITHMPLEEYNRLPTTKIQGMRVVGVTKLMEAFYKEFSEPFGNASRWPKVAEREKLLTKWKNPLDKKYKCSADLFAGGITQINSTVAALLEASYMFVKRKNMLISGTAACNMFLEAGGASQRVLLTHYALLSERADDDIRELFTELIRIYDQLEIITSDYPARDVNRASHTIVAIIDGWQHPICEFVQLSACTPYVRLFGRKVVSIDYLKYELYHDSVFRLEEQDRRDSLCKLQYLTKIQHRYYKKRGISELDSSPFQRFIYRCLGPFGHNVKIEILNRWLERERDKHKIIREWTPTHRIRKYPREEIPAECADKLRENCQHPCSWNRYIGRCTGLAKGTYRPADLDDMELSYQYMDDDE